MSTLTSYSVVSVRALPSGALLYFGLRLISLIDLSAFLSTRNFQSTFSEIVVSLNDRAWVLYYSWSMRLNYLRSSEYLPQAHAYADDSQLYLSFKADSSSTQIDTVDSMELCVDAIRCWMIKDKLFLNNNRTEFITIGTKQQLAKVNIASLCVGDAII